MGQFRELQVIAVARRKYVTQNFCEWPMQPRLDIIHPRLGYNLIFDLLQPLNGPLSLALTNTSS